MQTPVPKNPTPSNHVIPFDLKLRPARKKDAAFAEALYLLTMLPLLTALGLGDEQRLRARFAQGYKRECSKIACIIPADVGWIQLSKTSTGFHLDQLHLIPEWRGHGIGSYLIEAMLQRAGKAGATVALDVIRGNPAFALYQKFGFRPVEEDEEKHKMLWRPNSKLDRA